MTNKQQHLAFIHDAIARLAVCSFVLKFGTIIIVSLAMILGTGFFNFSLLFVVLAIWAMDMNREFREILFKKLFEQVLGQTEEQIDYSMDVSKIADDGDDWFSAIHSGKLAAFYLSVILFLALYWYAVRTPRRETGRAAH